MQELLGDPAALGVVALLLGSETAQGEWRGPRLWQSYHLTPRGYGVLSHPDAADDKVMAAGLVLCPGPSEGDY